MDSNQLSRRNFFKTAAIGGASLAIPSAFGMGKFTSPDLTEEINVIASTPERVDLSPAKWIWFPSKNIKPGSALVFKKDFFIESTIRRVSVTFFGGEKVRVYLNNKLHHTLQQKYDARWPAISKIYLSKSISFGFNVLLFEIITPDEELYSFKNTGLIVKIDIQYQSGRKQTLVTDNSWNTALVGGWKSNANILQESLDANMYHPYLNPQQTNVNWYNVDLHEHPSDTPLISFPIEEKFYTNFHLTSSPLSRFRTKIIGFDQPVKAFSINLVDNSVEHFQLYMPLQFQVLGQTTLNLKRRFSLTGNNAMLLTFDLGSETTGFPFFEIVSPGESDVFFLFYKNDAKLGLTNEDDITSTYNPEQVIDERSAYSRMYIKLKKGVNNYQAYNRVFSRYFQIIISGVKGNYTINNVGVNKRYYPFKLSPRLRINNNTALLQLLNQNLDLLRSRLQGTVLDVVTEEKMHIDYGQLLETAYFAFGDAKLFKNYIINFSYGQTQEGYFLNNWPDITSQKKSALQQLENTNNGPVLDFSIHYVFDCFTYYQLTGDRETIVLIFSRLRKFVLWLISLSKGKALLPVEDLGQPYVYLSNNAFIEQKHKICAFNLYVIAMIFNAFKPLCKIIGDKVIEKESMNLAIKLLQSCQRRFWDDSTQLFTSNYLWIDKSNASSYRYDDLSLALSVLFNLCPNGQKNQSLKLLNKKPEELGVCKTINSKWRLMALVQNGYAETVVNEWQKKWNTNYLNFAGGWNYNNTIPLSVLYRNIIGISPLENTFNKIILRPQFGNISNLSLYINTLYGKVYLKVDGPKGKRKLKTIVPKGIEVYLAVPDEEEIGLEKVNSLSNKSYTYYGLPQGEINLLLKNV